MWSYKDNYNLTGRLGSSPWTPTVSKTCPGKIRVKQFWDELIPLLKSTSQPADKDTIKLDPVQAKNFVISLYAIGLRRPPEASGAAYWERIAITEGAVTCLIKFLVAGTPEIQRRILHPPTPTVDDVTEGVIKEIVARLQ